jgi:hypothetical protein
MDARSRERLSYGELKRFPPSRTSASVVPSFDGVVFTGTAKDASWTRPPLESCTPEDFALDFMRHTDRRGDDWEAVWDILDNALRRSGRPMDLLGFYRECCSRGGFVDRDRAKSRLKMPHLFKALHNHYDNHTYTDIGNKLLDLYDRYFLAYEREHPDDRSVEPCAACGLSNAASSHPGEVARCASSSGGCSRVFHVRCQTEEAFRRSRGERVTWFNCDECRAAKRTPVDADAIDEADWRGCLARDAFLVRHVRMRKRRGRHFDEAFVRPVREAQVEGA